MSTENPRKVLRIVGLIVGVIVVAGGVWVVSDWGFWNRWLNRPGDMLEPPDEFYQPVAVVPGAPTPFFPTEAPNETFSAESLDEAAKWAESHSSSALLVWHDGRVALEKYWNGLGPDQLFTGRSMSKTLAPLMIGMAIQDGKIRSTGDRVGDYVEEWKNDPRGDITILQMLQHTSGFEPMPIDPSPFKKGMHLVLGTDFAAAAMAFDLVAKPGEEWAVHNVNSQMLGVIVERSTGRPFEEYLAEKLWTPLGGNAGELYMDRKGGMPSTYCCFRAAPRDWLRLGAMLASEGRVGDKQVVPAEWIKEMQTPSSLNAHYGYSVWLGLDPDGIRNYTNDGRGIPHKETFVEPDIYFLEGGGYRTLWIIPSKKMAILRLGYSDPNWDTSVIPNTILRGMKAAEPVAEPVAAPVAAK